MILFAKRQLFRFIWFFKQYKRISPGIELLPDVFQGEIKYKADGVVTSNNADFLKDLRFLKAYQLAESTNPWPHFSMQWRTYIICALAEQVKKLPGDFVECGVNTGAYARALIDYIDFNSTGKTFYLFDTYEGLVADQINDKELLNGIGQYLNTYTDVYEQVCDTFKPFNTKIIRGMVPNTLLECTSSEICYLSIDMNVSAPEIAALNYFWDKIVSHGVIILDDYGFPGHEEQKNAFDKFAAEKEVPLLYIPTGQAIIFKP